MAKNEYENSIFEQELYRSTAVSQDPQLCFLYVDFRPAFEHSGQILNECQKKY
jgi:hypothetical protein